MLSNWLENGTGIQEGPGYSEFNGVLSVYCCIYGLSILTLDFRCQVKHHMYRCLKSKKRKYNVQQAFSSFPYFLSLPFHILQVSMNNLKEMNKGSRRSYYISRKDIDPLAAICQTRNRNRLHPEIGGSCEVGRLSVLLSSQKDWSMFAPEIRQSEKS